MMDDEEIEVSAVVEEEEVISEGQVDALKGDKGDTGLQGPQGEPGYTPIKGVDYFTEEDKQEMLSGVEAEIDELDRTKADITDIPDVSNFITKDVNNLTYYTLKTATGSLIDLEINQRTYVVTLRLKDIDGNVISRDTIDLPLESVVIGGRFDSVNKKIVLTLENGNTVDIPVGDLISGLQTEITSQNKLASDLVDDTNSGNKFTNTTEKTAWNAKYDKPSGGIPKTDLASDVQTSLGKADTALQEHQSLADYVKNTDYPTTTKTGVIRTGYGTSVDQYGALYANTLSYANYGNAGNNTFIGKGTLESVINNKLYTKTQVDESQAEQDEEVEKLQAKVDLLESIIPTDTATGESLTLSNTARYPFKEFNVGGNTEQQSYTGKNLVNVFVTPTALSGTTLPTYSISEDGYVSYNNANGQYKSMMFNTFEVEPSTKYYSYADVVSTTGTPTIYITELDENNANLGAIYPKNAVFTTKANTKYLRYGITTEALHTAGVFTIRPMIVKSTTADNDYEPYVGGIASPNPSYPQEIENVSGEVEVKVANSFANHKYATENTKNWTSNGTIFQYDKINNNKMLAVVYTNIEAETSPTLTLRGLIGGSYSSNNKLLTAVKLNNKWAYYGYLTPLSTETKYWITNGAGNLSNITSKLFVYDAAEFEISDEDLLKFMANPVDVYEEQTATLTLPEGMEMCKIGDVQDSFVYQGGKWYKNKVIKKRVLNGTEAWSSVAMAYTTGYYFTDSDIRANTGGAKLANALCSHLKQVTPDANWSSSAKAQNFAILQGSKIIRVAMGETVSNLTQFKNWLGENNITIECELASPVLEEITDPTLISDLESLKNLYSYKGTTHISSTNEPNPVFEVVYRKSLG